LKKVKQYLRTLVYESAGRYALIKGSRKRFMNLGYKGLPLDLKPADAEEYLGFQLYHVASLNTNIKDKSILEIGCGRGGGCYFFKEYKKAASVTGIDLSKSNIKLARKHAVGDGINFFCQNAEKINLPNNSFDYIVNIESSHTYSDKKAFAQNVSRLLKPGGIFIYADTFITDTIPKIKDYLKSMGFAIIEEKDITPGIIASLHERPANRVSLFKKRIIPLFMKSFYGYAESNIYKELNEGQKKYLSFICTKKDNTL